MKSVLLAVTFTLLTTDLPQLTIGLHPNTPIIDSKYNVKNAFTIPSLPNIIAYLSLP